MGKNNPIITAGISLTYQYSTLLLVNRTLLFLKKKIIIHY